MQTPVELPYVANPLPYPLPSKEELERAPIIYQSASTRIANVAFTYAVKYGPRVSTVEAENMIFIKAHTRVPVPKVFAIYIDDQKEAYTYIVMEYVQGTTLASQWPLFQDYEKAAVAGKLKEYVAEIRSLSPPNYYGALGRRPMSEAAFWGGNGSSTGPFSTEKDLNLALSNACLQLGMSPFKTSFYGRTFPLIFKGHPPVFTHADLQRKNIMFSSSSDGIQLTLIDWEKSGWLPSYWEYCTAMLSVSFRDDWAGWLDSIMDPYYVEYPYLKMIYLDLWS